MLGLEERLVHKNLNSTEQGGPLHGCTNERCAHRAADTRPSYSDALTSQLISQLLDIDRIWLEDAKGQHLRHQTTHSLRQPFIEKTALAASYQVLKPTFGNRQPGFQKPCI